MTLKSIRLQKNVRQISIKQHLNISSGCISQWESGKRQPKIEQLPKLAEILDCSIEEIVLAILETKQQRRC